VELQQEGFLTAALRNFCAFHRKFSQLYCTASVLHPPNLYYLPLLLTFTVIAKGKHDP